MNYLNNFWRVLLLCCVNMLMIQSDREVHEAKLDMMTSQYYQVEEHATFFRIVTAKEISCTWSWCRRCIHSSYWCWGDWWEEKIDSTVYTEVSSFKPIRGGRYRADISYAHERLNHFAPINRFWHSWIVVGTRRKKLDKLKTLNDNGSDREFSVTALWLSLAYRKTLWWEVRHAVLSSSVSQTVKTQNEVFQVR